MKRLATLALTTAAAVLIASGPTPASATDADVSRALRADQTTATVVSGLTIGSTSEGSVIRDGAIQMTLNDSAITPRSQGVSSSSHTHNATVVRDTTSGFQVLSVAKDDSHLRDEYEFPGLRLQAQPSGAVVILSGDRPAGFIEAPWAVDAAGRPVQTHFEVHGSKLVQTLAIDDKTAFPVVADPKVHSKWWGYTIDFSRGETANIAAGGTLCLATYKKVPIPNPYLAVGVAVCAVASAIATSALAAGKCVTVKLVRTPTAIVPFAWASDCYA